MSESSRCVDPEKLSAFVAGTLSAEEFEMIANHLLTCDDCLFIVNEAARADREYPDAGVSNIAARSARHRGIPAWLAFAAAALLGIVALGVWWTGTFRDQNGIATLIDASPRDARFLEARPSGGFHWAPLRSLSRGETPADADQMKLIGAAGLVLEAEADDPSLEAQHASALAHLVSGHPKEAARLLTTLTRKHPSAQLWSDLAAARYTLGVQTNNPAHLAEALAAADAALGLDPKFQEAVFNRALILERLSLRQQARLAWERYLEVDHDSPWAREARQHLNRLAPPAAFRDEFLNRYWSLTQSTALARNLASRFPQEARVWGETEVLGRWAEAVKRNDTQDAARHLRVARAFAEQLAASHGDLLLKNAVESVEHVRPENRMLLADAHLRFRTAQKRYGAGRPAEAEKMFTEAARAFEIAGSPVALSARYFTANTIYDQGRLDEARERLDALLAAAPPTFPAYRAQLEWQLGLAHASRGRWEEAMRALKDSITTFEHLDERFYATSVREILAQVYDRIGDSSAAWHHRILALQELGQSETLRLQLAVFSAARAAAANGEWRVSIALLGVQLDMARSSGDDMLFLETLLLRARAQAQVGDTTAARADLAEIDSTMSKITDPAYLERARIEYQTVEAGLLSVPADAVQRLAEVIAFHTQKGRRMFLPELYLQRGRALVSLGRAAEAAVDFEKGIEELEAQRNAVRTGEERLGMFALAGELFDEAVALALARGESEKALAYSERGRARELLESLDGRLAATSRTTSSATIVEYVSLPSTLVIFISTDGRVNTVKEAIDRATLEDDVDQLVHGVTTRSTREFESAASRLHAHLIAPIAGRLARGTPLVFIPDSTLRDVPFAALLAPSGRYLIEEHSIVVAPSAAVHERLLSHPNSHATPPTLLLVEGATSREGEVGYLANADREAEAIESVYQNVVKLTPRKGDRNAFNAGAASADIIHFVGHASSDDWEGAALLTSGELQTDNRLDVHDIASASLTETEVVVLAACDTAGGREQAREGNISIARAFLSAGVPSVIATQWPIDDFAASEFFPLLHRHLARGLPPAEALRFAQIESIRGETPPFLWAAVQVIGS